jgi:chorismate synthase
MAACAVLDAIMIQASRSATANLLPPITTLPPTMVRPPGSVVLRRLES